MRPLILMALLLCFAPPALSDDALTIFVNTQPQAVTISDVMSVPVTPGENAAATSLLERPGFDLAPPPAVYTEEVDDTFQIELVAGSDISLQMQYAAGDTPAAFQPGKWPTATLRTAKSPAGSVLATYTTVIVDSNNAAWALRLSHDQTAALAGKTGYTELSMPDGNGNYYIWSRSKTVVVIPATQ